VKSPLKFATKWLREFASTYLPSNAELEYDPHDLREAGVYLADLTCFFVEAASSRQISWTLAVHVGWWRVGTAMTTSCVQA
jgi:hypothetical protein